MLWLFYPSVELKPKAGIIICQRRRRKKILFSLPKGLLTFELVLFPTLDNFSVLQQALKICLELCPKQGPLTKNSAY